MLTARRWEFARSELAAVAPNGFRAGEKYISEHIGYAPASPFRMSSFPLMAQMDAVFF